MLREPNITELVKSSHIRPFFSNPVFNPLSNEFDRVLKEKGLSVKYILKHFYVENEENELILDGITRRFIEEKGSVYFLLGRKGVGKTIFLQHYLDKKKKEKKYTISDNDIVIYLDLRNKKSDKQFLDSLPLSLFSEITFELNKNTIISPYLTNPAHIRKLNTSYKNMDDNTLSQRVLDRKDEAVQFLFGWAQENKYGIVLILDNIDDFPESSVKALIDKCKEFKDKFFVRSIISLRDCWHPRSRLKIEDALDCTSHLSKPNIAEVIKKRIVKVNTQNITSEIQIVYANGIITFNANDIIETFGTICSDLINLSPELHEELYHLANYNTREHILNMFYFFHSPYLFSKPSFIQVLTKKLKEMYPTFETEDVRPTQFFDFLENFMAIHYLFYDTETSQIFNLFYHKWSYENGPDYRNTLIYSRILQIVRAGESVQKDRIVERLNSVSYDEDAILDAIDKLLDRGLLESPDGIKVADAKEIRRTIKGEAYINKLIYEYSYLLYVCDEVPIPDEYKVDLIKKFGDEKIPLERGNLTLKHDSVRKFITFIGEEENAEENECTNKSGLLSIKGDNLSHTMNFYTSRAMEKMIAQKRPKTPKIQTIKFIKK